MAEITTDPAEWIQREKERIRTRDDMSMILDAIADGNEVAKVVTAAGWSDARVAMRSGREYTVTIGPVVS